MKLINLNKNSKTIVFMPETIEDLWILKNISEVGDVISGSSYRRLRQDETDKSERKPIFVEIEIEKFDFSDVMHSLRYTGRIVNSRPVNLAPIGEHHTLEIKLNEKYTIIKKNLYKHQLDLIKRSSSMLNKVLLVALDADQANVFELSDVGVSTIGSISSGKHGKRYDSNYSFNNYFDKVVDLISNYNLQLIIAGPGYVKNKFLEYLKSKLNIKNALVINQQNIGISAVVELFSKKQVSKFFKESLVFEEQELFERFKENLGKDNGKSIYGLNEVILATDKGAVEFILISEFVWKKELDNVQKLILNAEKVNTKVHIVDESHKEIYDALNSFTGIVAVLRYKL